MGDATWDDVGRNFTEVGRRLKEHWHETEPRSQEQLSGAFDRLKVALDGLGEAIDDSVKDEGIRDAARGATASFLSALTTSIDALAAKVNPPRDEGGAGKS